MKNKNAVVIIPARYASTRLPAKMVHPEIKTVTGKYLIEHVYQNISGAKRIKRVIVATDSRLIYDMVKNFGGEVEMTSEQHRSGTERIAEVAGRISADIVVNVQGDEPEMNSYMVDQVVDTLVEDNSATMATLANKITDAAELTNPNVVKVVIDNMGYALYFSRSQIPFVRDIKNPVSETGINFFRHLGIYAYRRDFLLKYSLLPASYLENAEKLEQLRALSNGYKIKVAVTNYTSRGIDTREDLMAFLGRYKKND